MVGFCAVEVAGVPPAKVQFQEVGLLVELSVNVTVAPTQTDCVLAVNEVTGAAVQEVTVINPACVSVSVPLENAMNIFQFYTDSIDINNVMNYIIFEE